MTCTTRSLQIRPDPVDFPIAPLLSDYWRRALAELRGFTEARGLSDGSTLISHTSISSLLEFADANAWPMCSRGDADLWRFAHGGAKTTSQGLIHHEASARHPERVMGDQLLMTPVTLLWEISSAFGTIFLVGDQMQSSWEPTQIIWAESFDRLSAFMHRYYEWVEEHSPRVSFWGGTSSFAAANEVSEGALILPDQLKTGLLQFADNFLELCKWSTELGIPARKGLLLAGHPGTGKTQFIRHLKSRLAKVEFHLFIAADRNQQGQGSFQSMLSSIALRGKPAAIVLEDLDRLTDSGAVTPEALLNSIDGLLELPVPVLWIATTNDPTALARNILDRPGRFDRIFVFGEPGPAEREEMLRLFSRGLFESTDTAQLVAAAKGLNGSHLKEACATAILEHKSRGICFQQALSSAMETMQRQRTSANRYGSMLRETNGVGFAG